MQYFHTHSFANTLLYREERLMIQMWVNVIGQQKNRTSSRYTSTCGSIGTISSFSSGPTAICVKLRKSILFIYLTFAIGKIVWWLESSTLPYNYVHVAHRRETETLLLCCCWSCANPNLFNVWLRRLYYRQSHKYVYFAGEELELPPTTTCHIYLRCIMMMRLEQDRHPINGPCRSKYLNRLWKYSQFVLRFRCPD